MEAKYIAEQGYPVYLSAFKRYKGVEIPVTEASFKLDTMTKNSFDDIQHYWGVFYRDNLIAYASNIIFGETVNYSVIKFDQKYLNLYPSYALIYNMNRYYLAERGFAYVDDGFRSIYHQSNIQEYLINKFGFRKVNVKLNITYKCMIQYLLKITFPFRKTLSKTSLKLKALYALEEIRDISEPKFYANRSSNQ